MTQTGRYHGGLIVADHDDGMLDRIARLVASTLEDYGHPVERQSLMNTQNARICASHYLIKLSFSPLICAFDRDRRSERLDAVCGINPGRQRFVRDNWRLQISMLAADPTRDDSELSEMLMAVMMYRMLDQIEVQMIEWLSPETVVSPDSFLAAFANVPPSLPQRRQELMEITDPRFEPLAPWDESDSERAQIAPIRGDLTPDQRLSLELRLAMTPEPEIGADTRGSDIRRLAVWGMTGMTAFLCAPVAVSMAAVNLARGEDFRLATHVLSLTGLLVMLQSSGALANAVAHLPL